jgi:hypothetical protein
MAKVLVSLDDALVRRLDEEAASRHISRSALLQDLAERGLGLAVGPGAHPEVHAALADLDALFAEAEAEAAELGIPLEDATDAIRAERDAR